MIQNSRFVNRITAKYDKFSLFNSYNNVIIRRSQWPRGLRRGSTNARLLGLWVLIPPVVMDLGLC